MKDIIGGAWILITVAMLVAMATGRVRLRSCCGFSDARCDLRLRDAYQQGHEPAPQRGRAPAPVSGADQVELGDIAAAGTPVGRRGLP
jgi:hypothetical protein